MLNSDQLSILASYINADPVMSTKVNNSDGDYDIATLLNAVYTPSFSVWNPTVFVQDIFDTVVWANMTPAQQPDGTQLWLNKAMLCQGKQFNLQTILSGRELLDCSKSNIRSAIQDALTGLPSKSDGGNQGAGWTNVQLIIQRDATLLEKIFSSGLGTTASPATMSVVGHIDYTEVGKARRG